MGWPVMFRLDHTGGSVPDVNWSRPGCFETWPFWPFSPWLTRLIAADGNIAWIDVRDASPHWKRPT